MTATSAEIAVASREFNRAADRLPTLFTLEDSGLRLLGILEDGNLDFLQESEVQAELALIDQMLMEKTESYVSVIRSLESMAEARKAEADRLRARAATAQHHADVLRDRLLTHMKVTGRDRIETVRFTLTARTNPPAVVVLDAAAVPGEFTKTVITVNVDKRGILDAFKASGEIPAGVDIQRGQRLEIK